MLRPEQFRDGMHRLAEAGDPRAVPVDVLVARARRRYRTKQALLPAGAAACVIALVMAVGVMSGIAGGRDAQPALPADESATDPRVPQDGDTVRAVGTLQLREDAPAQLCADRAGGLAAQPDLKCPGVDVVGLGPAAVSNTRIGVGGTWRSGTIEVQEQFTPPPAPGFQPPPQIPCPAPPGGWPTSRLNYDDSDVAGDNWKRYLQENPEYNGRFMQLVDVGGGSILVFLAKDEAERVRVVEEVSALVGADHVCSIISEVRLDRSPAAAEEATRFMGSGGGVFETQTNYSDDLTEQYVVVRSVTVTPELAAFEADYAGQVRLAPMVEVIDRLVGDADSAPTQAAVSGVSAQLCAEAAPDYSAEVAAAYETTMQAVRDYMADPHGADKDPTAPRPGAFDFPDGWDALSSDHQAAACYLDGPVPKGPPPAVDGTVQPVFGRRLVIAAEGLQSFMVSAGPQANMPLSPLGG